ncbi:amidase [Bordetella sp. BOR01]|uniref:amidase n=1 Tax=Bordetella sp. BOR01 TaxID=2854779 RepID=UPI001C445761|nr:amidase [Bordetella sp. BOR01]MBV7483415.1 amidase [Bordetella sp. BOR01]
MPSKPLWGWSATELAEAIARRDISSREAVQSAFERLAEVNPAVNAVVDILYDEASEAAGRADQALRQGLPAGSLHGVPVTVKIDTDYAGRPTTRGVVAYREQIAVEDAPAIANLRRAGAVIIGRTNVPAFTARYFTDNDLHGRTYNPWNRAVTPGGSSGGAAVATAVGIGALAHGTDRSGSVRYPAYVNGVYGLRASFGRVPVYNGTARTPPGLTSQITGVPGLFARHAADLRLGMAALSAPDPRDPWHVAAPFYRAPGAPRGKVGVAMAFDAYDVDPAVAQALARTRTALENAGYETCEVELPAFEELATLFRQLASAEEAQDRSKAIEAYGDEAVRTARRNARGSVPTLDFQAYIQGLGRRHALARLWSLLLQEHPLLLLPLSFRRPVPVDYDQGGALQMHRFVRDQHPMLAVALLGLPALALPAGTAGGAPVGVQLVGRRFHEENLIHAAQSIEPANLCTVMPIDPR